MRRVFFSLLVGASLMTWVPGSSARADDRGRADHRRYYEDREHHDRHEWNENENRAWRHWIAEERHRKYHDWNRADAREQREYWRWRHEHQDWR